MHEGKQPVKVSFTSFRLLPTVVLVCSDSTFLCSYIIFCESHNACYYAKCNFFNAAEDK